MARKRHYHRSEIDDNPTDENIDDFAFLVMEGWMYEDNSIFL